MGKEGTRHLWIQVQLAPKTSSSFYSCGKSFGESDFEEGFDLGEKTIQNKFKDRYKNTTYP